MLLDEHYRDVLVIRLQRRYVSILFFCGSMLTEPYGGHPTFHYCFRKEGEGYTCRTQ